MALKLSIPVEELEKLNKKSKTVVIWTDPGIGIRYWVCNKDISHLNHKYMGSQDTKYESEISKLRELPEYEKRSGYFPIDAVKEGAQICVTGWLL